MPLAASLRHYLRQIFRAADGRRFTLRLAFRHTYATISATYDYFAMLPSHLPLSR